MSGFSSLISGAECSTSLNPLSQVLKYTEGDRSLQRDRVGPSNGRLIQHLPSTTQTAINQADLASARQFFQGSGPLGSAFAPQTQLGHAPVLLPANLPHSSAQAEFDQWQRNASQGPQLATGWSKELEAFQNSQLTGTPQPGTPQLEHHIHQPLHQPLHQPQGFMSRTPMMGMPMYSPMRMGLGSIPMPQNHFQNLEIVNGKGKGKAVDFEAAFAAAEKERMEALTSKLEQAKIVDVQGKTSEKDEVLESDFQRVWNELNSQRESDTTMDKLAAWEAAYSKVMNAEREELDQDWGINANMSDIDKDFGLGSLLYDDDVIFNLPKYKFKENNPYINDTSTSLSKAIEVLAAGQVSLSEVAQMLEAVIQKGDLGEGGHEAWILLGEVCGMDEREDLGLAALREGVQIAKEDGGAGGVGLLSLAIAYTNEGHDRASQACLLDWLKQRYPEHASSVTLPSHFTQPWAIHETLADAFLSVARALYTNAISGDAIVDPELQVGLGVVFYISGDFSKASDCFSSALSVRPQDYILWNRYGSCLSNSQRPEEALGAYREALRLRPGYTRAVYNVGVACLNLGAYQEAAEHFLSGLAMQGDPTGTDGFDETRRSDQLWSTLRRTLVAMDRADLADKAKDGNLNFFRSQGFDF